MNHGAGRRQGTEQGPGVGPRQGQGSTREISVEEPAQAGTAGLTRTTRSPEAGRIRSRDSRRPRPKRPPRQGQGQGRWRAQGLESHPREEAEEFLDSVVEPAEERPKKKSKTAATAPEETPAEMNAAETNDADGPPVDPEEAEMMALMGFGGFGTTQGKQVEDANANVSAVHKKTTRRARQYMNRPGGFNRPLPEEQTGVKSNKI